MNLSWQRITKELQGESTTTITVAKGYCTPSRVAVSGAFRPLHIWFDMPANDKHIGHDPATGWPLYQTADIVVKRKQAAWAEYVLLSIKTPQGAPVFQVLSKPKNPRNKEWAARRKGIPMPWDLQRGTLDVAWVEHDCAEARQLGKQNAKGKTASHKTYGGVLFTNERRQRRSSSRRKRRR